MTTKRSKLYLIFTFTVTWSFWWLLAYFTRWNVLDFQNLPATGLFVLGGSAPTVGAYVAVYFTRDEGSIMEFNSRVLKYKVDGKYYGYALLVPVFLGILGLGFGSLAGHSLGLDKPIDLLLAFVPALFFAIILGGLEEFGWRGVLQPALTSRYDLFRANLIIGGIWSLWHLPLFFIVGTVQSQSSFLLFSLNAFGYSSFLTWLYFKKKSILLCVLLHASLNATGMAGLSAPMEDSSLFIYHAVLVFVLGSTLLFYTYLERNR